MMTGKKDRMWGILPKPGVSDKDIAEATKFGAPIKEALLAGNLEHLQEKLLPLGAVNVKTALVMTDKRGNVIFSKWAALITKKSKAGEESRKRWVR